MWSDIDDFPVLAGLLDAEPKVLHGRGDLIRLFRHIRDDVLSVCPTLGAEPLAALVAGFAGKAT
ncbi:MAG TPA: hypothetical protein VFW03_25045, partial [Gemmatimonadaceae bacterium]|nr:hypothetical protein [Gemmatimonadaceae bacterium]